MHNVYRLFHETMFNVQIDIFKIQFTFLQSSSNQVSVAFNQFVKHKQVTIEFNIVTFIYSKLYRKHIIHTRQFRLVSFFTTYKNTGLVPIDRLTNGQTYRQTDKQVDRQIDKQADRQTDR